MAPRINPHREEQPGQVAAKTQTQRPRLGLPKRDTEPMGTQERVSPPPPPNVVMQTLCPQSCPPCRSCPAIPMGSHLDPKEWGTNIEVLCSTGCLRSYVVLKAWGNGGNHSKQTKLNNSVRI